MAAGRGVDGDGGTAVITGLGVAAPNGLGTEAWWRATLEGVSGLRREPPVGGAGTGAGGRVPVVGRIEGFEAAEHLPGRLLPQTDRVTRLALAAGGWALADAGVDPADLPPYAAGAVTSNATGGFEFTHREIQKLWTKGSQHVSVYESFAWFYAVNTGQLSIRHGMRGASGVLVGEQAGGLDALGHARRTLRAGSRLVLAGGVESSLDPWGLVSHFASGRLSRVVEPDGAYLPFDAEASGYVPGEGGALLVMEEAGAARARGARVLGEVAGYAATFDPPPGSGRPRGLERAARLALADAGVEPAAVDVVFADAAGVPADDDAEAAAISALWGPYGVPVTAPKTLTGRLYGGGPPLDVAAALLALRDQVIPPTAGVARPVPDHRIDLVRGGARAARLGTAVVLARGHGGFNAAVVVRGGAASAAG
ncbi:beta-ketoacyl synthase N-terminal-like domain-containing protein [Streptomyces xiamenensis]|uniref:beta-ketoacyl synthase N-terminal-like domain-containing protein n=1 Tax=Streptomyces xiamenensis TaxID=408015 RepID=UPI0037D3E9C8